MSPTTSRYRRARMLNSLAFGNLCIAMTLLFMLAYYEAEPGLAGLAWCWAMGCLVLNEKCRDKREDILLHARHGSPRSQP